MGMYPLNRVSWNAYTTCINMG